MLKMKNAKRIISCFSATLVLLQSYPLIKANAVSTTVSAQVSNIPTVNVTGVGEVQYMECGFPASGLWGTGGFTSTLISSETSSSKSSSKWSTDNTFILLAIPGQTITFSIAKGDIDDTQYLSITGGSEAATLVNNVYGTGGGSISFTMPSVQGGSLTYMHHDSKSNGTYRDHYRFIPLVGVEVGNPSSEQAAIAQQVLLNYKASNTTTLNSLQLLVNSCIDTSKFTANVYQSSMSYANESVDGVFSGSIYVTDNSSGKQTASNFSIVIPKLPQSLNTVATSLKNFVNNYNATNASSVNDFINAIAITNQQYTVSVTGWSKFDATASAAGTLSATVNILDNGNIVQTIPLSKTIAKLADTAVLAKSSIDSALSSYTISNLTTPANLLALAKSVINTNYITVTNGTFSKTDATETTKGTATYSCNIKDTYGNTSTSSVTLVIPVLNQSLDTVYNLYNNYIGNLSAYNNINTSDILNGVLITNSNIKSSINDLSVVNATDTTEGSLTGTLTLKQIGYSDKTIPINKTIARLPQTGLTSKSYLVSALSTFAVSNNTTQSDYENLIKSTIDTLKVNYSISGFKVTPATETTRGYVSGLITLKDSYGTTQNVNIPNVIDYLVQSQDTLASLYDTNMSRYIGFNTTTENDILGLVNISNADITAKMLNYFVDPATDTRKGRITGIILLTNAVTGKTKSVAVNIEINHLEQEMATSVKLAQDYIKSLTSSNTMDFTSMLNQVNTLITNPNIAATWDYGTSNKVEKLATETSQGNINKIMVITDSITGVMVEVPVIYSIPKLNYTVAGVKTLVENALINYSATNYTDEDNLINYLINNISDIGSSSVSISIDSFSRTDATETTKGALNGSVIIKEGTTTENVSLSGKNIELLPQTIDGISELISNSSSTFSVKNNTTNITLLNSIKKLVTGASGSTITLLIDSDKFSLTPSTIDNSGVIKATVEIIDSKANRLLLPINVPIAKLPQTVEDAMTKSILLLNSYSASNSTTITTLENLINTVITGANGSIISLEINDYKKVDSTDIKDGTISGTIEVSNNTGTISYYSFNLPIARTGSQQASGLKTDLNNLINSVIADPTKISSMGDLNKLIEEIKLNYPGATVDSSKLLLILPSSTSTGTIKGSVVVASGSESVTIPFDVVIPQTDNNKVDGVLDDIKDSIDKLDVTTIVSMDRFNSIIDAIKSKYSDATIDASTITYTSPTTDDNGIISGTVLVTIGSVTEGFPVSLTIPKDIAAKLTVVSKEISGYILANKVDSENSYTAYINSLKSKYPDIKIDSSGVVIKSATTDAMGSIIGNIVLTSGTFTNAASVSFSLSKLTAVAGGNVGGGSSSLSGTTTDTLNMGSKIDSVEQLSHMLETSELSILGISRENILSNVTMDKISTNTITENNNIGFEGINSPVSKVDFPYTEIKATDGKVINGDLSIIIADKSIIAMSIKGKEKYGENTNIMVTTKLPEEDLHVYTNIKDIDKYVEVNEKNTKTEEGIILNGIDSDNYLITTNPLIKSNQANMGWYQNENKEWLYINNYATEKGWTYDNGWYFNNLDTGKMQAGWLKNSDGNWYYLNEKADGTLGKMQTGWHPNNDGNWYYLNTNGSMARDTYIDGYYLDQSGAWVK